MKMITGADRASVNRKKKWLLRVNKGKRNDCFESIKEKEMIASSQ